jgi:hypothetical protein
MRIEFRRQGMTYSPMSLPVAAQHRKVPCLDVSPAPHSTSRRGVITAAAGNDVVGRLEDANRSGAVQADGLRRAQAQVEAHPANERPAVVDEHSDRFSGARIGYGEMGAERQRAMGGRQAVRIERLAARGVAALPIIGGHHAPSAAAS